MVLDEISEVRKRLVGQAKPFDEPISQLLTHLGFTDQAAAYKALQSIARDYGRFPSFHRFSHIAIQQLSASAGPSRALLNFERFAASVADKGAFMTALLDERRTLEILVMLFAGSQFLTDVLIKSPDYFSEIQSIKKLSVIKSRQQMELEAHASVKCSATLPEKLNELRRFQKKEFLRIGSGDLFGLIGFQPVIGQLTSLARAITQVCLDLICKEYSLEQAGFAVLGLGKLGGRELNYSSDIDLIFLARSTNEEKQKLGRLLIDALSKATEEGFLYRVDMRLRPWGSAGRLVPGLEENVNYIEKKAELWEKQAFYKARFVAGDEILAISFRNQIQPCILDLPKNKLRREILKMKGEIEKKLKLRGKFWGEVKSGVGSIRDVEFVTQFLQITTGTSEAGAHSRNTLDGLARLATCKIIENDDYRIAAEGYVFLRSVEHHLQIMHDRQTHQLPQSKMELTYLARRLGFAEDDDPGRQLVIRYQEHSAALRSVYEKYINESDTPAQEPDEKNISHDPGAFASHIKRLDAAYTTTFSAAQVQKHAEMADSLNVENTLSVHAEKLSASEWEITIVSFDYTAILSTICGLFVEFDLAIIEGAIFTYQPEAKENRPQKHSGQLRRVKGLQKTTGGKRKIVDVFKVRAHNPDLSEEWLQEYTSSLSQFVQDLRDKKHQQVQGEVARRVALSLQKKQNNADEGRTLPAEIAIDNNLSAEHTVIQINAPDTIGFLYELTNALTLNGINIFRVIVRCLDNRAHDTLFLTNVHGRKITDPEKLYQLRATTVLVKHFTHLLPRSSNPQSAILHFRELVTNVFSQSNWHASLTSLEKPDVLDALARMLGVSDFLWSDFLRMQHDNLFPIIQDLESLKEEKSRKSLLDAINSDTAPSFNFEQKRKMLNEFKDREMFRIDMRYIQGLVPYRTFFGEITDLAEIVVEKATEYSFEELSKNHGLPRLENGKTCPWCVMALGKFGGRGLGFASDIELMFLYEAEGKTDGEKPLQNSLFFERMVNALSRYITAKNAGIFEIDMRLRPYGKHGNLAVSLASFKNYYCQTGSAWPYERQALVRLRPIAGNQNFAKIITNLRDSFVYGGQSPDIASIDALREKQHRELVAGGAINAKFSPGGLVDLEYLVQLLQMKYGKDKKSLRTPNTDEAIAALHQEGVFSHTDFEQIRAAHTFLRILIEALRMVRGNAKDLNVPLENSKEYSFLIRRLGYVSNRELKSNLTETVNSVQRLRKKFST